MKTIIFTTIFSFLLILGYGQSTVLLPGQTTKVSDNGDNIEIRSNNSLIGIQGLRFNGTIGSKTPIGMNNDLFRIGGGGYFSSTGATFDRAIIRFTSTENWTSTAKGTKISFSTTKNGSITSGEKMYIGNDGKVGIGVTSASANLHINEILPGTSSAIQLTNEDTGISSTDGLHIGLSPSSFLFSYAASIINKENSYMVLGSNNNNTQLVLDNNSNVGIGTLLTQDAKLTIEANSTCCGGTPYATLTLKENEADGSRLRFTNSISTSNSLFWDVFGSSLASGNEANAAMNFYYATGAGTGINALTLRGNGNVGMGNISPVEKLHVDGGNAASMIRLSTNSGLTGIRMQNNGAAGDWSMHANEFNELFWTYSTNNFTSANSVLKLAPNGVNYNLNPFVNDQIFLGSSSTRWKEVFSVLPLNVSSDRRLKKNIKTVEYGLAEVMRLKPVSYNWKNPENEKSYLGFIAQEVESIVPEVVTKSNLTDNEFDKLAKTGKIPTDTYGMDYTGLIPVLVKAIQEQQAQINAQGQIIAHLEAKLASNEENSKRLVLTTDKK